MNQWISGSENQLVLLVLLVLLALLALLALLVLLVLLVLLALLVLLGLNLNASQWINESVIQRTSESVDQ